MRRRAVVPRTQAPPRVPDAELVERCQTGDTAAWRALHERYAPAIHRFIAALGIPPEEREDAEQDVFVAVYRNLARFRGEAQLSTWIYRIAVRHAIRLGRQRRLKGLLSSEPVTESHSEPASDPAERVSDLRLLDRMLRKLSAKKRTVFVLFEIEGMPVPQIARVLGCPENTVWSRLHQARLDMLKTARKALTPGTVPVKRPRRSAASARRS
jgi:RNA polymerase sigma-70 factor (ECF subfamily)